VLVREAKGSPDPPERRELRSRTVSGAQTTSEVAEAPAGTSNLLARIGIEATYAHITLLGRKQEQLRGAQIAAEEQLLHRAGQMYAAGEIGDVDLIELYEQFAPVALPGFTKRWDAAISLCTSRLQSLRTHHRHVTRNAPNMPDGTWRGTWPLGDSPVPIDGTPVFYMLYDDAGEPCYAGSSEKLRGRLQWHERDGKPFVQWTASRCADRESAYQLEDRHLGESLPYLNKRRGR
jgi:hypothetical protein